MDKSFKIIIIIFCCLAIAFVALLTVYLIPNKSTPDSRNSSVIPSPLAREKVNATAAGQNKRRIHDPSTHQDRPESLKAVEQESNSHFHASPSAPNHLSLVSSNDLEIGLAERLENAASRNSWSDRQLLENKYLWTTACRSVDERLSATTATLRDLLRIDARLADQRKLKSICKNLAIDATLELYDEFLSDTEKAISELDVAIDRMKAMRRDNFQNEILEELGPMIKEALNRENEAAVLRLVSFAAFESLLDPLVAPESGNFNGLYQSVVREVAAALICSEGGGCIGGSHPFVLRQCVERGLERGAFCMAPRTLDDAIYQTLTPLEFEAFQEFRAQVRSWMNL